MTEKVIQEKFGQDVMNLVANFAKAEIRDVATLESTDFAHVDDPAMRKALAETLYGARWIYKLGVALWVQAEQHFAHVRAQVIDYGSVCEALLGVMIVHGVQKGHMKGQQWKYSNFNKKKNTAIKWTNPMQAIEKTSFEWRIKVAHEEGIIDHPLRLRVGKLKMRRNTVHLTQKVSSNTAYYVGLSRSAFTTVQQVIAQTKAWRLAHP